MTPAHSSDRPWAVATRQAAGLLLVAVVLAVGVTAVRPDRLSLRAQKDVYELKLPAPVITATEARQLYDAGTDLFIDTRDGSQTETVPGAFMICANTFDDDMAAAMDFVYPEDALILYDDGTMQIASAAASRFLERGYTNVKILEGGMPAWLAAGGPVHEDGGHDS